MNVSAIIVTRGDVDLKPVLASFPEEWERLVWNNGTGNLTRLEPGREFRGVPHEWVNPRISDLSVYGRYAAIEYTDADLIYVQDDDCVVSDPEALVDAWVSLGLGQPYFVVCNMPPEFRHEFYEDHALVGFGACFHRDAPERAFAKFGDHKFRSTEPWPNDLFARTCDIVFTALTPRVLVDVPVTNLWWADDPSRLWRQPTHVSERTRMLELVRQVRDA